MHSIIPHLWYDKEAKEAAMFYISLFDHSSLVNATTIEGTPSGEAEIIRFEIAGQPFSAISAGPYFKFNPSISLMVACNSIEEVDVIWNVLSDGGLVLMALGEYPFSRKYGWIQDRFGLSWQLIINDSLQTTQKIMPNMLFSNDSCGKAEEAVKYYVDVFKNSAVKMISKYGKGEAKSLEAKVNYSEFNLNGYNLSAMDNAFDVDFSFNEAFSFIISCDDQSEIDYYWEKLSAVPVAEQCGWLKDRFGVSWQIIPSNLDDLLLNGSQEEKKTMTEAFLKMKKINIDALTGIRSGRY